MDAQSQTLWTALSLYWSTLSPTIQAALIGTITTVATATLGALLVIWQIGRQAKNAIQQNRHNESINLKLEVYREIILVCRFAMDAETEVSSFVRSFKMEVELFRTMTQQGYTWNIPKARYPSFLELEATFNDKSIELIRAIERWNIIDPRIHIFQIAFNCALHNIRQASQNYSQVAMRMMPTEIPNDTQGNLFPWIAPNDAQFGQLEGVTEQFLGTLMEISSYASDFQLEMQNLLLGELFDRELSPRKPIYPRHKVIRIENYNELKSYFLNDTDWGINAAQVEENIRTQLGT